MTDVDGRKHFYSVVVDWTGNLGTGTSDYRAYRRDHMISAGAKPPIPGSADSTFRGDAARWNPEELLVAALSACHKLWYLSLCASNGVIVITYRDEASGTMVESSDAGGSFTEVILSPKITIESAGDFELAVQLHHEAHAKCFLANSVKFPVRCEPVILQTQEQQGCS